VVYAVEQRHILRFTTAQLTLSAAQIVRNCACTKMPFHEQAAVSCRGLNPDSDISLLYAANT